MAAEEDIADCVRATSTDWSEQETWIWRELCDRRVADLDAAEIFGTAPDVTAADWPESRVVRSKFLVDILTAEPFSAFTTGRSVAIRGAIFREPIKLDDATIDAGVYLTRSRIESISLQTAKLEGSFSLDESSVAGFINMNGASLGAVLLRDAHLASDIDLISATIERAIEFDGSEVSGKLDVNGASMQHAFLRNAHFASEVSLTAANIAGSVDANGTFDGELSLNQASVAGVIKLSKGTFGGLVDLIDASSQRLLATDATFRGPLWLDNASIRSQADLGGSSFADTVSMSGMRLEGVLILAGRSTPTEWLGENRLLDLTGASAEGIDDTPDAWPPSVLLSGFTLTGTRDYGVGKPGFLARDSAWYLDWLQRDDDFHPANYAQIENLLTAAGRKKVAIDVGMVREARERASAGGARPIFSPVHFITVGYGYHPEWILPWIVGFTVLGAVAARFLPRSFFDDAGAPSRLILSAHRLIPLISFGKGYADIDVTSRDVPRLVRWYFYVHAVVGYVLAAILVTALAGITATGFK